MDKRRFDDLMRRATAEGTPRRAVLTGLAGAALAGTVALVSPAGVAAKQSLEKQCRKGAKKEAKAGCKTGCKGGDPEAGLNQGQCMKACIAAAVEAECGGTAPV
jgi:hypothetical protein